MNNLTLAAVAAALLISSSAHAQTETTLVLDGSAGATGAGVSVEAQTSVEDRASYSDADKDEPSRDVGKPDSDDDALTPALLELDGVKGETTKGKSAPVMRAVQKDDSDDDDMDDDSDDDKSIDRGSSRRATNFGVLLGGSDDSDDSKDDGDDSRLRGLERAQQVLTEKARASDQAIESVSLNFDKITTRVKKEVLLFGVVSVNTTAEVEIDEDEEVKVRFPWWTFLATEKDGENLGLRIKAVLASVVKAEENALAELIKGTK